MNEQNTLIRALRRTNFILIHTGMMLVLSGFAIMLFVDAKSWEGSLDVFKAMFSTVKPESFPVIIDPGVIVGWAFLALYGSVNAVISMFLVKESNRTGLQAAGMVASVLAPISVIFTVLMFSRSKSAVQLFSLGGIVCMFFTYAQYIKYSPRRIQAASDFIVSLVLVMAMFLTVNIYMHRHNKIHDLSSARFYALSKETKILLKNLTKKVKVYVILMKNPNRKGLISDYTHKLFTQIQNYTDKISVEYVPPYSKKANIILKQYNIVQYSEAVIYECGERTKSTPIEPSGAPLAVFEEENDPRPLLERSIPEIKAYKGENAFYLAINEITTDRKKQIVFLEGHGERSVSEFTQLSLSNASKELKKLNYIVLTQALRQGELPLCDALVIVGPKTKFLEWEVELIGRYLKEKNGSLIYFPEPIYRDYSIEEAGLAVLLKDYGIEIQNDVVVLYSDQYKTYFSELSSDVYSFHPITKGYTNEQVYLSTSRSVKTGTCKELTMESVELFSVNAGSNYRLWGETRFGLKTKQWMLDENDTHPPLGLAVLCGPKEIGGKTFDSPRIVVIGDADMIANKLFYKGNNRNFILNCMNWAIKLENIDVIPPKDYEYIKMDISDELMANISRLVVMGIPGFILLYGIVVLIRRRV